MVRKYILCGYYRIKGIGIFAWIPLGILYILLPLTNYAVYSYMNEMDMVYCNIVKTGQKIIPLCYVWYIFFLLYHLVEEPGNEVLYVFQKNKICDMIFPYSMFLMVLLPLFGVYTYIFPELWFFYLKICMINLMYTVVVFSISYVCGNIVISVISIFGHIIYQAFENSEIYDYVLVCEDVGKYMRMEILPYLVITIVCIMIGYIANCFYTKYK